MEQGPIDIGILLEPIDFETFDFLRLKNQERWVLLMRPDDPLAAKEAVSPDDLKGKPLILPSRANVRNEVSNWFGDTFSEAPEIYSDSVFAWKRSQPLTPAVERFVKEMREFLTASVDG